MQRNKIMKLPPNISKISSLPKFSGVLCDIDDTLTHNGKLVPEAFLALQRLQDAGIRVVPITGRPGGWVDQIARMWPVDGVVGENGGLWYWFDGNKLQRRFAQDESTRLENREKLQTLSSKILSKVPGTALASDQPYRDLDLAIDFCEDVPALKNDDIDKIAKEFQNGGATCKISSIHVNGWFGTFDKLTGFKQFHVDRWGVEANFSEWAFFGDSANDEPMFHAFDWSFGVANVQHFLDRLTHPPKWITNKEGGYGFVEGVDLILKHHLT
jgi:HAD superfamily hydrolase (TIGR01484 family)